MFSVEECTINEARPLFEAHHGYKSASCTATYCFCVAEQGLMVAAYAWQPPPVGAAKSVCPEAPSAVLALSRMAAVPKRETAKTRIKATNVANETANRPY